MGRPRIVMRPTPMIRKQAGIMRKLLGLWGDSKRKSNDLVSGHRAALAPGSPIYGNPKFLDATQGLNQKHITRRQIVLNRHFTEIISDVLANNLKRQISDIGVTVRSIETKAWNKGVSVFYYTNEPFESSIHQELNTLTTRLRAAIAERRLIGRTPVINFIYDKSAEMEQNLDKAIKASKIKHLEEVTDIAIAPSNQIQSSKGLGGKKTCLFAKRFTGPDDMSNMILGLDYPSLYNQVAMKLERGRGESSRMVPHGSLASTAPFIRIPSELANDSDELDATRRILKMQNFLVSQRKKSEYMAKLRRQQELCARDSYKWDLPEETGHQEIRLEEGMQDEELDYN